MSTWSPITQSQMEQLLRDELATCDAQEQAAYEHIRIPLRAVSILRSGKIESVYAVGEREGQLLVFEDVEQGFEWCVPDTDGVIRSYACSQAGLQGRLYELLQHDGS